MEELKKDGHYPRVMLAAPASGSGKTLITCGILQALVNRGLRTASFKCGPDYIDPMFHARVIGTKSKNLDTFFTGEETTGYLFARTAAQCEISVIEGVMGYYDGLGGVSDTASSYDVAKAVRTPVILIVNGRGASLSLAAQIKGFLEFREDSRIVGVIVNQVSAMIYPRLKEVLESELDIQVLGYVPKIDELALESRHLGLVLPEEVDQLKEKLQRLAGVLEETVDLEQLIKIAENASMLLVEKPVVPVPGRPVRIGVARDEAFCFTYEDNLKLLEEMKAELVYFSPLRDRTLPKGISGMILSGGYPELYARELSENTQMRRAVQSAVEDGCPVIAECGGFLYLHEMLQGKDEQDYPMVGVIPGRAMEKKKLGRFGYITLSAYKDQMLLKKGEAVRGHEFHYWESENCGCDLRAKKPVGDKNWDCAHGTDRLYAGFPHLFYYSNPGVPFAFLTQCANYQEEKQCLS